MSVWADEGVWDVFFSFITHTNALRLDVVYDGGGRQYFLVQYRGTTPAPQKNKNRNDHVGLTLWTDGRFPLRGRENGAVGNRQTVR